MTDALSPTQLRSIALDAAMAAASTVRAHATPERYTGTINGGGDRVLTVDLAADDAIRGALSASMAHLGLPYAVLSEESGYVERGARYPLFIVDPVDGSAQARRRHPDCAVSIAVARGPALADLLAAVVHPLVGGDAYSAVAGGGAWLGDRPLPLAPASGDQPSSLVVEGTDAASVLAMARRFVHQDPRCQVQISGSIALQLALLAAGSYDLLLAGRPGASGYDIAAGWLIVREAGAAYADLRGLDSAAAQLVDRAVQHQPVAAGRLEWLERALSIARASDMP